MRRRYVRTIQREEPASLLLMAAGAIAGAAAGLYLGRRYRTLDAFVEDMRDRFGSLREIWYDDDELEDDPRDRLAPRKTRAELEDVEDDELEDHELEDDDLEDDELEDDELEGDELADDDLEDELEADLAAVVRDNGMSDSARTAEARARALEQRVLEAFRGERVLAGRAIEIAVVGEGVVELTGTVHTLDEIPRAAAVARRVPGVAMVLNRVEVGTGGPIDTASVERAADIPAEPVPASKPTA